MQQCYVARVLAAADRRSNRLALSRALKDLVAMPLVDKHERPKRLPHLASRASTRCRKFLPFAQVGTCLTPLGGMRCAIWLWRARRVLGFLPALWDSPRCLLIRTIRTKPYRKR